MQPATSCNGLISDQFVFVVWALAAQRATGVRLEVLGNHWKFESGHSIQLELSQTDAPYFKPDSLESTIQFSSPELSLPAVEKLNKKSISTVESSNDDALLVAVLIVKEDGTTSIQTQASPATAETATIDAMFNLLADSADWVFTVEDETDLGSFALSGGQEPADEWSTLAPLIATLTLVL